MANLTFYDSAYPPFPSPAGFDGVAGYIGGDTPHVWSVADWNSQHVRFRLPIFTRSNPPGPGSAADVASALAQLKAIGAPKGSLVAWDMETAEDSSYISQVYTGMKAAGYPIIVYGSQSFVEGNANPDGLYWGAEWTNVPHFHSGDAMTQWESLNAYDEDLAVSTLPFWDTQSPPPPPPPPVHKENDNMGQLTAQAFVGFPPGTYKEVVLFRDFLSKTNTSTVRVAILSKANGWVVDEITLNASAPVTVTFAHTDSEAVSLDLLAGASPVGYSLF